MIDPGLQVPNDAISGLLTIDDCISCMIAEKQKDTYMIVLQGVGIFHCSGVPNWRSKPRRGLRPNQDIRQQLEESQERVEKTVQTYFVPTCTRGQSYLSHGTEHES